MPPQEKSQNTRESYVQPQGQGCVQFSEYGFTSMSVKGISPLSLCAFMCELSMPVPGSMYRPRSMCGGQLTTLGVSPCFLHC